MNDEQYQYFQSTDQGNTEDQKEPPTLRNCTKHNSCPLEYLNLKEDFKNILVCAKCIKTENIKQEELLNIKELFGDSKTIKYPYPPLKNNYLFKQITQLEPNNIFADQIERYFSDLKTNFLKYLEEAQSKAINQLIKFQAASNKIIQEYKDLAEIKELKELIYLSQEQKSAEKDLEGFIKTKWKMAHKYAYVLEQSLSDLRKEVGKITFERSNDIAKSLIDYLKQINFFDISEVMENIDGLGDQNSDIQPKKIGSLLETASLIKSKYGQSDKMILRKNQDKCLEMVQTSNGLWQQALLNAPLDPNVKYVIWIEVDLVKENNQFFFGIVPGSYKDEGPGFSKNLSYCDYPGDYGVKKEIKGSMWKDNKATKRGFEIRIHLANKYFRIGTLPKYDSIIEISNPGQIISGEKYWLFIINLQIKDVIRITKLESVQEFNNMGS